MKSDNLLLSHSPTKNKTGSVIIFIDSLIFSGGAHSSVSLFVKLSKLFAVPAGNFTRDPAAGHKYYLALLHSKPEETVELFALPLSPPSRAVHLTLKLLNVPHKYTHVRIGEK
jgi:hypothetical protein